MSERTEGYYTKGNFSEDSRRSQWEFHPSTSEVSSVDIKHSPKPQIRRSLDTDKAHDLVGRLDEFDNADITTRSPGIR